MIRPIKIYQPNFKEEIMTSFIHSLKNEYEERNQNKITFSIRLSIKEDLILQEVADAYDLSRQEVIHRLITEQIVQAWENERNIDKNSQYSEHENSDNVRYFLLNTNSANDVADHDFMMREKVAAAFEDGYKEKIKRLKKGDWVFLYASGKGVVAYGQANGVVEKAPHYHREDKTFFQRLDNFTVLETPIKAREIKEILEREFPFAQTLSRMEGGEKLLQKAQTMK